MIACGYTGKMIHRGAPLALFRNLALPLSTPVITRAIRVECEQGCNPFN